jgi:hypothetical protein
MKTYLFLVPILFILSSTSQATQITVKKVKGRQAIVETGLPLEEGQTYELQKDQIAVDVNFLPVQQRKNSLQLGAEFQSVNGSSVQDHRVSLTARYGWNFELFEFGPMMTYQSVDLGAGTDSDFLGGGYFDYNFQKNRAPQIFLWGPTMSAEFGAKQFKSGASANLMNLDPGAFVSWFFANSAAALRAEAVYHYQKITTTTTDTTLSGFKSKAYLVFYF